jgi:pimeloyl-ACP methyl ester carboxylesterase
VNPIKVILGVAAVIIVFHLARWGWQEWQLAQPGFHETAFWFSKQVTGDATCGYLVVRENRQAVDSRTIRLPVVIFAAEPVDRWKPSPAKEPILYLTGGPGGSAYLGEQRHVDSWWLERRIFPKGRDLIVMGQRGTGLKEPDFDCEEFDSLAIVLEAHARGAPPPDIRALTVAAAVACAERLQAEGIDLTAYNSRESVADIAELRVALGIEEWNLYGVSYGTRLALSALRYQPAGIRTVILDSVFPPEAAHLLDSAAFFRTALHRFLTGCIGRAPCEPPPDGLWAQYLRAHERLRQQPVEVDLSAIDPDAELVVTVDERGFDKLLLRALYSRESRGSIAAALRRLGGGAARNGEVPIRDLLTGFLEGSLKGSDAVSLSHICRDEMSFESAEQIVAAAVMAGRWRRKITEDSDTYLCPIWPSGAADAVENTPVESDVPALLLAGILDPVTPPDLARSAAENLANSHVFEFLDAGHGVIYEVDCAGSLISEFLDHPRQRPKGDCRRSDLFSLQ